MRTWILPCNTKQKYDAFGAFEKFEKIDWHQSQPTNKIEVGDIAYIYAKGIGICFKCIVTKTGLQELETDDREFCIDNSYENGKRKYFEVRCVKKYTGGEIIPYEKLKGHGLKTTLQGPLVLKDSLLEFFERLEKNDINVPLKPLSVEKEADGRVLVTCGRCRGSFIKAPRCPECGQLQEYGGRE